MATKLLPAAKIGVKKKTISADSIRPNYLKKEEKPPEASEKSSNREILFELYDIKKYQEDWIMELLLFLEYETVNEAQRQLKAEYDRMKKK